MMTHPAPSGLLDTQSATSDLETGGRAGGLGFVWLEITGKCQLECAHCYADSGPGGTHGTMSEDDWIDVIDQLAALGVKMVQFIGGEPTLHPSLPRFINHALSRDIQVEVFSNLVHLTPQLWEVFSQPRVSLATSYYSTKADEHKAITKRPTYSRTKENIAEAVRRSIPLRAGVIGVQDQQDVAGAVKELHELGVNPGNIGIDHLRQVGRGQRDRQASVNELCGKCANGVIAVMADGTVQPCVFTRWPDMTIGNICDQSLTDMLASNRYASIRHQLTKVFTKQDIHACEPGPFCGPRCNPWCKPSSRPSSPTPLPRFGDT